MLIINISGYQFITLNNLADHQSQLLEICRSIELKGTILLSQEGINLSIAGEANNIIAFKTFLSQHPVFNQLSFRDSQSDFMPFNRLKVQIKKEIITLRADDIHPEQQRAPEISPQELKQWLDEQRDIVLLDTRNDYEVKFGAFNNAINPKIDHFSEFAKVKDELDTNKPVVMYCTGGIRCEKAALQLMQHGFKQVYQLQHGILNYFKEVGSAHFTGECFVFDQRISIDANLAVTGTQQCKQCQGPITTHVTHVCSEGLSMPHLATGISKA